jgi:hypothetical protein
MRSFCRLSLALTLLGMSRTNNPAVETVSLHRALDEWGEGASNAPSGEGGGAPSQPGDATWLHTSFATGFWASAGGDFSPGPSASTGVGGVGVYAWSSAQLAGDVADFLASPADDHGWVVIGNEAALAKRFDGRTNPVTGQRPQLTIDFNPPPPMIPAFGSGGTVLLVALLLGATFAAHFGAASGLSKPA